MHRSSKLPAYVQAFVDRGGKARFYFRRPGYKRVSLPGLPWSPDFMAAYEKAAANAPLEIGAATTLPGSLSALIVSYYKSPEFVRLAPITKSTYRNLIERLRNIHGQKRFSKLEPRHVKQIMLDAGSVSTGNGFLKVLRILGNHAIELGWRSDNPAAVVKKSKTAGDGYRTWTEEAIEAYRAKHLPGTKAALALDLLLYTTQRREDVVRMGRQHVTNGVLTIWQQKTGARVDIPLHRTLIGSLEATPRDGASFLMTDYGKPFTPAGFGNWFHDRVVEAGLPDGLSAHGLRKAGCCRLAEAGCTATQIMSISGHRSLSEVERYVREASRKAMARDAMDALTAMLDDREANRVVKSQGEI